MEAAMEKWFRRKIETVQYRFFLIPRATIMQQRKIRQIRKKGCASIVFLVSSLPMWKFQPLFDLLRKDARFRVSIAIHPFPFCPEKQCFDTKQLVDYFSNNDIPFLNLHGVSNPGAMLRASLQPDIMFYPQPYLHYFNNDLDCQFFFDKLICYIPYAALTSREVWAYKNLLNNVAWRIFYPSEAQKKEASEVLYNGGKNIRITGEYISDLFRNSSGADPWKKQSAPKKRIIWAPHYSLHDEHLLHRNSFVWLHRTMVDIAHRYKDKVQFSFKPHPRLLQSLYETPEWGKEKTDAYYRIWQDGENTQLDTGSYIDLFKHSDAMIMDSSSFTVEYHYTGKPFLFTTKNLEADLGQLNTFGREAILAQYVSDSEAGIIDFIEKTVLEEADPRKSERDVFYDKYLRCPGGVSVSENIYNEILKGLSLE